MSVKRKKNPSEKLNAEEAHGLISDKYGEAILTGEVEESDSEGDDSSVDENQQSIPEDSDSSESESDDDTDTENEESSEDDENEGKSKDNDSESGDDESDSESGEVTLYSLPDAKKKSKNKLRRDREKGETSQVSVSDVPVTTVNVPDEYDYDSSDEEDIRNTVGNIPMEWYKDYDHIGYNLLGQKLLKPAKGDQLDDFLSKMDDPNYGRTVKDKTTGQKVIMSEKDIELVRKLKDGEYVDMSEDPYAPWIDFFTHEKMLHPVTNRPETKESFIPSRLERLKVGQYVNAIKMGWMKPSWVLKKEKEKQKGFDEPKFYDLWGDEKEHPEMRHIAQNIPAPKLGLPGHEESYNPPPEYMFTEAEKKAWEQKEPETRRIKMVPQKFDCMRHIPGYARFINERFERCLDLYLCPRQRKMRVNVDPEELIPKLPKPKDLRPFPTTLAIVYKGHKDIVRCISPDPSGQWIASGSDDKTVRLWEVATGRCMKQLDTDDIVRDVAWNPNPSLCLLTILTDKQVTVVNPLLGDKLVISNTDSMLESYHEQEEASEENKKGGVPVDWQDIRGADYDKGLRIQITHKHSLKQAAWHARGDYLAVVAPEAGAHSVVIHQVSKRKSQCPFKKSRGLVQKVLFHPTRPFLFVATQRFIRVYNLIKQELTKKLTPNVKWISSMDIHPGGDNLIVGSYDYHLVWFDLDLSRKPYQVLRHHKKAIRQVAFHKRYPLFASSSDDGSAIVCHGKVFSDLLQNPLIVPVKILRGHLPSKDLGVLGCQFHPTQPWLFSSGADNTVHLYT